MNYLPFILFALVVVGLLAMSSRSRRRAAQAEHDRAERIDVGTEVMTTSGLHGTVVSLNGDGTVMLSIAAGVEVRWELAALRDTASLPARYVHDEPSTTGPLAPGPDSPAADAGRGGGADADLPTAGRREAEPGS